MNKFSEIIENKRILIVDDEGFMRIVLSGIVKHIGCKRVLEARDGKAALAMLEDGGIDVVFCDWEMPGMSGVELFEKLKESDLLESLKFVMVTGNASAEDVQKAVAMGIKEYIVKPFNELIIMKKLESFYL